MKNRPILRRLFSYFVRGLLFVAPVGFTIFILYTAFNSVDSILQIKIPTANPYDNDLTIPGVGFFIVISGTMLIGFIFSVLLPQTFQNLIENAIRHLPLVRLIYFSLKDLVSAFVGDKKKFTEPVLLTLNKENGIKKLGFITQKDLSSLQILNDVAVYCPHSYAFSGELYIVSPESFKVLAISSADVMKTIISGGVSLSNDE